MEGPILIQGAMSEEIDYLIERVENREKIVIGPWHFFKGTLSGVPVVVYRNFIGMVNAAGSTALAIERFKPLAIINQGTAGAHRKDIRQNDIVIGERVINIGAFETNATERGLGTSLLSWKQLKLECADAKTGGAKLVTEFYSDKHLVNEFYRLKDEYKEGKIFVGAIGSADLWNKEIDRIDWFNESFGTLAEEMEAAAVAQLCQTYNLPFLSIRVISNNEMYKDDFNTDVALYLQKFIEKIMGVVAWKDLRSM